MLNICSSQGCHYETWSNGSPYCSGTDSYNQCMNDNCGAPQPTEAPVSSNPMCQDTWLPFLINGKSRNCKFVSTKNVEARCGKPGVTDLCPLTCGEDCTPFDTVGTFEHKGRDDRDCAFVAKKPANRCNKNNLRSHCPVTCAGYSYD